MRYPEVVEKLYQGHKLYADDTYTYVLDNNKVTQEQVDRLVNDHLLELDGPNIWKLHRERSKYA